MNDFERIVLWFCFGYAVLGDILVKVMA